MDNYIKQKCTLGFTMKVKVTNTDTNNRNFNLP